MKNWSFIACMALWQLNVSAQLELELLETIKVPANCDDFTADQFGNIYIINGEELRKLNKQGKELYSYSDPIFGDISYVDALNAMNPLVFYNDVNQLRILDNRLNSTRAYNLLDAGFIDPSLVAYSDQNNIWLYDQVMDRLVRFDLRTEKVTSRSLVITQISGNENRPIALFSSFDRVLLQLPNEGLMVFDAQGSYIRTLPLKDSSLVSFNNQKIISLSPRGGLRQYDLGEREEKVALSTISSARAIFLENNKIYVLKNKQILIFRLKARPD